MDIREFINARFLVPPIVGIFFIFLANPLTLGEFIDKYNNALGIILVPILIFSAGFLISTLATAFLVILFKFRRTLSSETLNAIKKAVPPSPLNFLVKDKRDSFTDPEIELITWLAIMGEKESYLRDQIHKRWHAFNASVNSIIAMIIAWQIVIQLGVGFWTQYSWWQGFYYTFGIILVIAFLFTAINSFQSVKAIDNLMVYRILDKDSK